MNRKAVFVLTILFCVVLVYGVAVTSDPWDGTGWNTSAPNDEALVGNSYKEIYDLRKGIGIRMDKEHIALAASPDGGEHQQGSARAFFQDAAPGTRIDGDAFDANDLGSLWFDSNAAIDNQFNVLTATTPTWTPVSTEIIAVAVAAAHTWASTQTFNGGIVLGAGDDLIGSSTSDITINTNKFTVAGATGNTIIAGTLTQQGVATLADTSALATSGAPAADAQIANKKYVDDACVADGTTVFDANCTAADTFQDLDLSSYVGSNFAIVHLEVHNNGEGDMVIKTKGYGSATSNEHRTNVLFSSTIDYNYISIATDTSGFISIDCDNNTDTVTIKLIGYIK